MNLELRIGRPGGRALVEDYVEGRDKALAFFSGWHGDPEALRAKASELDARFSREERERAARAMEAPTERSRERLERFVEEGGLLVGGGQQPGLFTGPLYTIYKALTQVAVAERLETILERPVLPAFWVASEDHDWAEVDHAWVVDLDNELRRVELERPSADDERPIFRVELDEAADRAVEALAAHLPETDFSAGYMELLREEVTAGRTLSRGFRGVMAGLLGELGVCFVDAADPVLKEASRDVLAAELEAAEEHESLLAATSRELEEAGYHVQVPVLEGGVNLFVEGPEGRERLYRDDGSYHLRHSGERLGREEILARIREDASTVSPNVLLRPVVESVVFPTVSIVCGPGEISYFAQLRGLFGAHGLTPPVVMPRFTVALVEAKVGKVLEKFELEMEQLRTPHHELAGELTRDEIPEGVRRALGQLRGWIGKGVSELVGEVREVDPTLKGPVEHVRSLTFAELDDVEKKIVQALKRDNEIALTQLEKAQLHLFPRGKSQERVLNVFYYLVRYGPDLLPTLLDRFRDTLEIPITGEGSLEAAPPG